MNFATLAFAATLAAVAGCTQTALAQTQDQTGASPNQDRPGVNGQMMNGPDQNATTGGAASDDRSANEQNDEDSADNSGNGNPHRNGRWSDNAPMRGPMGPMWRRHMMMPAMGAARFHFARGNARIDVRCSVQEDTQACVRAAGELLDKIAQMRRAGRDNTTGSAAGEGNGAAGGAAPGASEDQTPGAPGERM